MRQTALKPLVGIVVALGTIAGVTNAAFASSAQPDFSRAPGEVSTIDESNQLQSQRAFQVAQFSLFPWSSNLDRRENASREVQRCLDQRSRRDRENCLTELRNNRRNDRYNSDRYNNDRRNDDRYNNDRYNNDRRNDRNVLSREEKRCLEKRSYRDRESCLTELRNDRRNYDRRNYDRRSY